MLKIMKNDFDSNCCWIFQAAEKEMLGKWKKIMLQKF